MATSKRKSRGRRPPKGWFRHCVEHVKRAAKTRSVALISPEAICGAAWRGASPSARKRAKRRHAYSRGGSSHSLQR